MGKQSEPRGLEPVVFALTLCDQVNQDSESGKFSIAGTFFRLSLAQFPAIYPICIYACLADGRGATLIRVRLIDADEEYPAVIDKDFDVDFNSPDLVLEFGIEVSDCRIERPGVYRLQLLAGNATIIERSIYVDEMGAQE